MVLFISFEGYEMNLKPCPFCGGEARLTYSTDNHRKPYVTCDTPKCPGCNPYQWHFRTETEAIEAWNRRAERTAKVDKDTIFPVTVCGICHSVVAYPNNYCSECGAKLDWSE